MKISLDDGRDTSEFSRMQMDEGKSPLQVNNSGVSAGARCSVREEGKEEETLGKRGGEKKKVLYKRRKRVKLLVSYVRLACLSRWMSRKID